jgi:DNA-binding MarR family transcriptional regulator
MPAPHPSAPHPSPFPSAPHPSAGDQRDLIDALAQTAFITMAVLSKIGAEHDLSLTQLRMLGILRDRRLKMSELADYLGLDKSTVSGLVDRAERRGLLQRTPNLADRRAVDVQLSPDGMEFADRGATLVARSLSPLTSRLTRADTHRLTTLLERMLHDHPLPAPVGPMVLENDS